MSIEVKVPTVGESISEVTIASWTKQTGDYVKLDEVIGELESDKATFELTAPAAGYLKQVAQVGDNLPIGGLICYIDADAASPAGGTAAAAPASTPSAAPAEAPAAPAEAPAAPAAAPAPAAAQDLVMKVPAVGESINEVTIANWNKKDGDLVKAEEILCEIESDKATFELAAEASGILTIKAPAGTTLSIGDVICVISATAGIAAPATAPTAAPAASAAPAAAHADHSGVAISPVAAAILQDKGIAASAVKGSGPGGKITKEDAMKATSAPAAAPVAPAAPAVDIKGNAVPAAAPAKPAGDRAQNRTKMTSLRKTVARRLVAVKNETAMLTTFNEVDMKPIMDLRNKLKDKFKEKHGVGLGFMSFFTKACATALAEFPAVNAFIDGDEIVNNNFVDVSIAVSAPKGLVVPVIRNAEKMSFAEIEKEVIRLATLARDNKLTLEQMTGGTFTITNGGVFGSMLSTPIINAPQSAILGMHNIVERPVAINGEVVIRPIMYVALSYDHRIIDGRESVGFLVRVKQLLEDPIRLLLEV